nr:AAA family ATPase [uncultured Macellibacteroides sp.]
MAHLIIRNIGPIKEVDIELNKINVIMGPQSSGKSTINKIACYCSWVEKTVLMEQSFDNFNHDIFVNKLISFHKLDGYIRDDSYIHYESNVLKMICEYGVVNLDWKDKYAYKRPKISFIPSERNIIATIPNWWEVKFSGNNIRNFMAEWNESRVPYTVDSPLEILKLGVKYYYDKSSGADYVSIDENNDLKLTNTSSGLQSIIPLCVLIEYLTRWIYDNLENQSVKYIEQAIELSSKLFDEVYNKTTKDIDRTGDKRTIRIGPDGVKTNFSFSSLSKEDAAKFETQLSKLTKNQNTELYIEEPEQNLFPSSQRDLMYFLLKAIKGNMDHKLFLTTHSPYILYALNNCMMGYLVKDNMPEDEAKELLCYPAWIDPKLVSVWEIVDGRLRNIQDKDNIVSENYFDQKMTELTNEYYQMLNYYEDEE